MKKFFRAIFSLMIVIAAICTVFMINTTKVAAVEGNIKYDNNYKSPNSSGSASSTVFLYKVSVYVDTDGTANKTSPISEFEIKKTRYIGEDFIGDKGKTDFERKLVPYGGTKSKFEYLSNTSSLPIKEIKKKDIIYWDLGKAKINLNLNSKDEGKKVEAFFGGSDGSNCYQFVQAIDSNISKDDSWVLIVEPVIRTYTGNVLRYYTPTEYAVAINSGGYDSFNTGPNSSCALLTLAKPGDLGYLRDGTWLHAGNDNPVESSWSNFDYSGKKNAWLKQSDYYIKYAGVFVWFSGAFEYSDYTLADGGTTKTEKFENEEIEISTVVNRTNPGKAGTVDVTLDLQDYGIDGAAILQDNAKQSVTFDKGQKSKTVKWKVNVGSYGNYSTNRSYNYTIEVAATGTTKELNTDNNTLTGTITLKRDFQVTKVSLDKDDCFENGVTKVSFSVKNANPYKEYDELPITVYFTYGGNTARIGETTVNLGKSETKNGSCSINVGSVTDNCDQTDTVTVVINSWNISAENGSKYSEPNMANNKDTDSIRVKRDINLSVSIAHKEDWRPIGNAPSKVKGTEKTQAMSTCAVSNHSRFNLYETDPMNDKVTVTFYVNNKKIGSQTVPVPRYGSNLVWFKWDVPESSSVTIRAEVSWNVNQESAASPYSDNTASKTLQIEKVYEYDTPDMGQKDQFEQNANSKFSDADAYQRIKPYVAKWSQWICDDKGTFTRIDYAMTGDSALELVMDEGTGMYEENTMVSGAGISAVFTYDVRTECSEPGYDVSEKDYTYAQNVVASFPEFNYVIKGDCRTMYLSKEDGNLKNAEFRFEPNVTQDPTRKRRVHFTPMSMPDGEYKVGVVASQMWTPAGPIFVNANSSVMINESGYDMFY